MHRPASKNTSMETPIGTLSFGIEADAGDLDAFHISIRPVVPELPWGMSVEACVAVLLKGVSSTKLKHLEFYCKWDDLQVTEQGNSGEGFEAWEWGSDGKLVMIGTEDSGQLNSRLHPQQESASERYQVTMMDNRISVRVEEFAPDKALSLHFLVAWNPAPEPRASSCWYAVDMAHQEVMDQLNPYKVGESEWGSFPHIAQAIGSALGYRVGEGTRPQGNLYGTTPTLNTRGDSIIRRMQNATCFAPATATGQFAEIVDMISWTAPRSRRS